MRKWVMGMRKTFCDRCGDVVDDGENGEHWNVTAVLHMRDDTSAEKAVDREFFELCPECYRKMFEVKK